MIDQFQNRDKTPYEEFIARQWQESLEPSQASLKRAGDLALAGPSYLREDKSGAPLSGSCQYFFFDYGEGGVNDIVPTATLEKGVRHYLVFRDAAGEVVATRITTLYVDGNDLSASSRIRVRDRGKGMARIVDSCFVDSMQQLSNELGKKIIWRISNENLENLNELKAQGPVHPELLAALEEEQARWKSHFENNPELGIVNKRRVFVPTGKQLPN